MNWCEHEYGVTGGTIYCIHCPAEWDLVEVMATNPPKRRPVGGATAGEATEHRCAPHGNINCHDRPCHRPRTT